MELLVLKRSVTRPVWFVFSLSFHLKGHIFQQIQHCHLCWWFPKLFFCLSASYFTLACLPIRRRRSWVIDIKEKGQSGCKQSKVVPVTHICRWPAQKNQASFGKNKPHFLLPVVSFTLLTFRPVASHGFGSFFSPFFLFCFFKNSV